LTVVTTPSTARASSVFDRGVPRSLNNPARRGPRMAASPGAVSAVADTTSPSRGGVRASAAGLVKPDRGRGRNTDGASTRPGSAWTVLGVMAVRAPTAVDGGSAPGPAVGDLGVIALPTRSESFVHGPRGGPSAIQTEMTRWSGRNSAVQRTAQWLWHQDRWCCKLLA
jgi:hypothetical protein